MRSESAVYQRERIKRLQRAVCLLVPYHVARTAGQAQEYRFSRGFATSETLGGDLPLLGLLAWPSGNTQTVETELGRSSIGTFLVPLVDRGGEVLRYLSDPAVPLAESLSGGGRETTVRAAGVIAGYPAAGTLDIDGERIRYGTRDDASLTFRDCRRGVDGTSPARQVTGALIRNGEQIRAGQRMRLYVGYEPLAQSQLMLLATLEVARLALAPDGLTWALTLQDVQRTTRSAVFTAATTEAVLSLIQNPITMLLRLLLSSGTVTISSGTVQVKDASTVIGSGTAFDGVLGPGDWVLVDPFAAGEQLLQVDTVVSGVEFKVRGATGVATAAGLAWRKAGAAGKYDVYNGANGLAMPPEWVDVVGLEALREAEFPSTMFEFRLNQPERAKDFIESELLRVNQCYPRITADGRWGARRYKHTKATVGAADFALTEDDIVQWAWSGGDDRIINQVEMLYDWNRPSAPDDFTRRQRYTAAASKIKYGLRPVFRIASKGIVKARDGQAIVDDRAYQLLQRHADPPPVLTVVVPYRWHVIEVGDICAVTHTLIPNLKTGLRGLVGEKFEVRDLRPVFGPEGHLILTLLHVGALEVAEPPSTAGEENALLDINVQRATFYNSAAVTIPGLAETETGSVTVSITRATDTVLLEARQHLVVDSVCGGAAGIYGRLRYQTLSGPLLDEYHAPAFMTGPADKLCASAYYARRGNAMMIVLHSPQTTGRLTYKLSAFYDSGGSGTSRERSLAATVRSH